MFIYWSLYGKLTVLITSVNDICSIHSIYNTHVRGQINVHLTKKNFLSFFSVKDIRARNKSFNPDSGRFTDSFFSSYLSIHGEFSSFFGKDVCYKFISIKS